MNGRTLSNSMLIAFFLSNYAVLEACSEQSLRKVMCVSLGWNCFPALNFNKSSLRYASFPFDWNQTSFYGLYHLLENSFADFLNPEYLVYERPGSAGILNIKHAIAFSHDFPVVRDAQGIDHVVDNYVDYIPEIQEKYDRRIKRLYAVCSMAKHVYFFRTCSQWSYDNQLGKREVEMLRDLLRRLFPQNNWTLVVINREDSYRHDWQMPQVNNFYMHDENRHEEWEAIFRALGLMQ